MILNDLFPYYKIKISTYIKNILLYKTIYLIYCNVL